MERAHLSRNNWDCRNSASCWRERERRKCILWTLELLLSLNLNLNNNNNINSNNPLEIKTTRHWVWCVCVFRRFHLLLLLLLLLISLTCSFVRSFATTRNRWISLMASTTTSSLCTWLVAACMSVTCDADRSRTPQAMFRSSKKSRTSQFNVSSLSGSAHSGISFYSNLAFRFYRDFSDSWFLPQSLTLNLALLSSTQPCVFNFYFFYCLLEFVFSFWIFVFVF